MKRKLLVLAIAAVGSTTTLAGVVKTEGPDIIVKTEGGFEAATEDGQFSFEIGGRLQWDYDSFDGMYNNSVGSADKFGDTASDSELRRGRVYVEGTLYKDWNYKFQFEFAADGASDLEDAYIQYTGLPVDITVGRFKKPFGLEELTSSKYISTIERTEIWEIVEAGRSDINLQLSQGGSNYSWAVGLYESGEDEAGDRDFGYGGRVTFAPIAEKNHVLHFGGAYYNSNISDSREQRFRSRFAVHTADRTTLIGNQDYKDQDQFGLEAAWMMGPFSVQGEYVKANYDGDTDTAASDVEYEGYYVQGTWTITGESRGYKAGSGKFDKIKPKGPGGAWELVAKFESGEFDVDNQNFKPAYDIMTLGVNWYANKNVRLSLNYLNAEVDDGVVNPGGSFTETPVGLLSEDDGQAISGRVQVYF